MLATAFSNEGSIVSRRASPMRSSPRRSSRTACFVNPANPNPVTAPTAVVIGNPAYPAYPAKNPVAVPATKPAPPGLSHWAILPPLLNHLPTLAAAFLNILRSSSMSSYLSVVVLEVSCILASAAWPISAANSACFSGSCFAASILSANLRRMYSNSLCFNSSVAAFNSSCRFFLLKKCDSTAMLALANLLRAILRLVAASYVFKSIFSVGVSST